MTPVGPITNTAHDQKAQIKLTIIIDRGALPARAVFDHLLIVKCLRRVDYAAKNFILASFSSAHLHRGNDGWKTPIRLVASSATAWITKGNTDAVAPHSRTAESITSCRQEPLMSIAVFRSPPLCRAAVEAIQGTKDSSARPRAFCGFVKVTQALNVAPITPTKGRCIYGFGTARCSCCLRCP